MNNIEKIKLEILAQFIMLQLILYVDNNIYKMILSIITLILSFCISNIFEKYKNI